MDRCEREHQAMERIKGWLDVVFFEKAVCRFPWESHRGLLFDIFKESYPILNAAKIRGHLEEAWQKDHSEQEWQEVCDEILAVWDEWRYAWDHYPANHRDDG